MCSLTIYDATGACDDGKYRMRIEQPSGITVHMFGVPGVVDALGIATFYRDNRKYTGGQMPYSFVMHQDGKIEMSLPMFEVGPHALRWSSPTVGVVALGDFNSKAPPADQWSAASDLCAELCTAYSIDPMRVDDHQVPFVAGHTERPESTRHTGKVCPGSYWPMPMFRRDVYKLIQEGAIQRLSRSISV